jgi:hypothetical protein
VKTQETFQYIGIGKDTLKRTAIVQNVIKRTNEWDFIKLKHVCIANKIISTMKQQHIAWEKIFAR